VDSDIVIKKEQQAKELVERWEAYEKMWEFGQRLRQNFDRYEWWPRHSEEQLECIIKTKQDKIMKLRILAPDDTSLRITHLNWDIENIESVLATKKQSSILKYAEYGMFAQRYEEHWRKMGEYYKETQRLFEEFKKDLPTWLGGHDKSWLTRSSGTSWERT
jgi:hypothetical protein